jgi:glycyl-tRNA synthetase beta chain
MAQRKTIQRAVSAPLLVELLTEELPPRSLKALSDAFAERVLNGLVQRQLKDRAPQAEAFATPRRLAVLIPDVLSRSPDRTATTRLMPSKVAFDGEGKPTVALQKRLEKEGLTPDAALPRLERATEGNAEYVCISLTVPGLVLDNVLGKVVEEALEKLPIPKVMRWGAGEAKFVRPVHGLVMLHGSRVVPGSILGLGAGRKTAGHRFLGKKAIVLKQARDYAKALRTSGKVIAGFDARRKEIERTIRRLERKLKVSAISTSGELADFAGDARLGDIGACHRALRAAKDDLLPEVTALVELPAAYVGRFDEGFLDLPMECLTLSMRQHQRYFPCFDRNGRLVSTFLIVSNLETPDGRQIVGGNERVLRARLSDAKFFYDQDRKTRLEARVQRLANVVYHAKLGSQLQRVERIRLLAGTIARRLDANDLQAERAALLSKADLLTEMVGEFPELQGIMGRYYALHDGEPPEVADAIEAHYQPRYAGDELPRGNVAVALALSDKLDTLAGMFGIGQAPTGDRDPFGLRRAALGVIRILIERDLPLSLHDLVNLAFTGYGRKVADAHADLQEFVFDRLAGYLKDRGYTALEIDAVVARGNDRISDTVRQLEAVRAFNKLPEAQSLAAANKRVVNILKQAEAKGESFANVALDELKEPAERALFEALASASLHAAPLLQQGDFTGYLKSFAVLKSPVDAFFDSIMVMVEDRELRKSRLALLADLRTEMNRIADISKLVA